MKNHVIIQNLSYLQDITENTAVVGGNVSADTFAMTDTGSEYAVTFVDALALGEITYTNGRTSAIVKYYGDVTLSMADARATAYARTGNKTAHSSNFSTSTGLSFNSFSSFEINI